VRDSVRDVVLGAWSGFRGASGTSSVGLGTPGRGLGLAKNPCLHHWNLVDFFSQSDLVTEVSIG
jgi:hypothetical protein